MKKSTNLILAAFIAASIMSCKKDDTSTSNPTPTGVAFVTSNESNKVAISGSTATDYTFKADTKYLLKGFVYVKAGATLTIEPGTVIFGDKATKGTLIIERGAKIIANGTAQKPIVFTSAFPKGSRNSGDWGGVIILGNAPTNLGSTAKIEGGVDREFGGSNPADNSGSMKYVRIEFGGIAFQPDNEINGLTLGGVGNGTTLDYIQVSYAGDDAIEWFGGTVNGKHLVAYKTLDDMFDTDNGYSGKNQFLVGLSDPNIADVSGSNGFESDNDANGSTKEPKTTAIFANVSLFGPLATTSATCNSNFKRGAHIRRNSGMSVYNSVIAGWPVGLLLDDQSGNSSLSEANAKNGTLVIKNTVIAGTSSAAKALTVFGGTAATATTPAIPASTFDVAGWYNSPSNNNKVIADNASAGIAAAFNLTAPNFVPNGGPLSSGGSTAGLDSFFENVSYIGAFGTTDWTTGWTNYDPQNANY